MGIAGCYNLTAKNISGNALVGMADTWWYTYTPTADPNIGRRGFSLSFPTAFSNTTKLPVVIYNHSDENIIAYTQMISGLYIKRNGNNTTNDNDKFILVCTQAGRDGSGYKVDAIETAPSSNSDLTFYCRADNDIPSLKDYVEEEIIYLNVITQLLDKGITLTVKLDKDRFYMVGYSGGAFLTQVAATKLNNSIAAFASVAGHKSTIIPHNNNFKNGKNFKVPMLLVNATSDDNIGFAESEAIAKNLFCVGHITTRSFWQMVNGVEYNDQNVINTKPANIIDPNPNITVNRNNFKDKNTGAAIEYFKTFGIIGGGHHWHRPGAFTFNSPDTPGMASNKLCVKINTTDEVWNFFKNKKKSLNGDVPTNPNLIVARTANPNHINEIADINEDTNSSNVTVFNSKDNNELTVQLKNLKPAYYTFSILNLNNSIVKKQVMNSTNEKFYELNLDISDLPKGIYILQISNENVVIETKKFIK
jgi:hypothetical protein